MVSKLEPRVRHAFWSAKALHLNMQCHFPSHRARNDMPAVFHPALASLPLCSQAGLEAAGITSMGCLMGPGLYSDISLRFPSCTNSSCTIKRRFTIDSNPDLEHDCLVRDDDPDASVLPPILEWACRQLLASLLLTNWHPSHNLQDQNKPSKKLCLWLAMTNTYRCIRFLSGPSSILA